MAIALAMRFARERDLDRDRLCNLVIAVSIAGLVGARLFYLVERDPGDLLAPPVWLRRRPGGVPDPSIPPGGI